MSTHDIRLEYADYVPLKLQRDEDQFIMECFRTRYSSPMALKRLNRVRVYLQALTLADVTTGDGTTIQQMAINARLDGCKSKYGWANECPSTADKSLWAEALQRVTSYQYRLPRRLGAWTSQPHKNWGCYHDPTSDHLHIRLMGTWWRYEVQHDHATRGAQTYRRAAVTELTDPPGLRATARPQPGGLAQFEGAAESAIAVDQEPTTIHDAIDALSEPWILDYSSFPNGGADIAAALRRGGVAMVSDGSYMPDLSKTLGASGWIIEDLRMGARCVGSCRTPGKANAYRAELFGIYTMLVALSLICKVHEVTAGEIETEDAILGCDNEVALWKSSVLDSKVPCSDAHADIIRAIRKVRDTLPLKFTYTHIYGHQDDHVSTSELDRPTQLNIECDNIAKRFLIALHRSDGRPEFRFTHEGWRCFVGDTKVTSRAGELIRDHIGSRQVKAYYAQKGSLTSQAFDMVDWEAMGLMLKAKPPTYEMWLSKHVSHLCATGRMMKRMQYWASSKCQCCEYLHPDRDVEETTKHILVCPAEKMIDAYEDSVSESATWLDKVETEPTLARCIVEYLSTRGGSGFRDLENYAPSMADIAEEMDTIGWYNFMEGKTPLAMRRHQEAYYTSQDSRRTAERWATGLVEKLVKHTHTQWTTRNHIVHERAADGLSKRESAGLKSIIELQFDMGTAGLGSEDHYLLRGGMADIWSRRGPEKMAWLRTVEVAREAELQRREREDRHPEEFQYLHFHNRQPSRSSPPTPPQPPRPPARPTRQRSTAPRRRRRSPQPAPQPRQRRRTSSKSAEPTAASRRRKRTEAAPSTVTRQRIRPSYSNPARRRERQVGTCPDEPASRRSRLTDLATTETTNTTSTTSHLDRAERRRRRRRAD